MTIIHQIDQLRNELNKKIGSSERLTAVEIVELSEKLDRLIELYYKGIKKIS